MEIQTRRGVWFGIVFGFAFGSVFAQTVALSGLDHSRATPWALLFSVLVCIVAIPMGLIYGIFNREISARQLKTLTILIGIATLITGVLLGVDVSSVRTDANLGSLIVHMLIAEIFWVMGIGIFTFLLYYIFGWFLVAL